MKLTSIDFCSHFLLVGFVLLLFDEGNQLLHVKESLVLYVNETRSNVKYDQQVFTLECDLHLREYLNLNSRQQEFHQKLAKIESKTDQNVLNRTKDALQAFCSAMVAALEVQKRPEDQNQGS